MTNRERIRTVQTEGVETIPVEKTPEPQPVQEGPRVTTRALTNPNASSGSGDFLHKVIMSTADIDMLIEGETYEIGTIVIPDGKTVKEITAVSAASFSHTNNLVTPIAYGPSIANVISKDGGLYDFSFVSHNLFNVTYEYYYWATTDHDGNAFLSLWTVDKSTTNARYIVFVVEPVDNNLKFSVVCARFSTNNGIYVTTRLHAGSSIGVSVVLE